MPQGHDGASSLRYALACGSVVLWPRDPVHSREEFFHPMLKVKNIAHPPEDCIPDSHEPTELTSNLQLNSIALHESTWSLQRSCR